MDKKQTKDSNKVVIQKDITKQMNNPQLSRKEEIEKEIDEHHKKAKHLPTKDIVEIIKAVCDYNLSWNFKSIELHARLDERIRAEQDFLKMIREYIHNRYSEINKCQTRACRKCEVIRAELALMETRLVPELKSTIQKENKNG